MPPSASSAQAVDDIQRIHLGPHTFYVPKSWMKPQSFVANAARTMIDRPQPSDIVASTLGIEPRRVPAYWGPSDRLDGPDLIILDYGTGAGTGRPPLEIERQRWFEQAASLEPDREGFVRVGTGFTKPGEPPQWERFVYKGYRNALGDAFVVDSSNTTYPSSVGISFAPDMTLRYRFNNEKVPERAWWGLYQHVLAFLDHLQMPK
jgi:hypothetical protein